ncbi:MAG: type II toxin-antitoxin system RelB/DinJ family antitoxin [Coriobacteriales bacterium]|jgi:addiction module RelB/DinJ family antitoxin|nr:type II toxin-antitoxin system RelB/DinJ family antitoxin [Coriobacteriales bacterium]
MSTVTVRMDADMKREAERIVGSFGINLPTALRMFTAEIVRTKSVPVKLERETSSYFGLTGEAYHEFLLDAKRRIDAGERGTVHELIEV